MTSEATQHSGAWVTFSYASFLGSAAMVVLGIVFLPVDLWVKAYLAMGVVTLIQSCITVTKTMRDVHEARRMVNRIEDAKTERLLMSVKD